MFEYLPPSDIKIWYENWKKYVQILRKLDIYIYDIKELPREFQKILKDLNIRIPENIDGGVFAYVPEGIKLNIPIEIAYYVSNYDQKIFNVLILEKNVEITTYIGCVALDTGKHKSITYEYLNKHSKLTTVKLHFWKGNSVLKAKTFVYLDYSEIKSYYLDLYSQGKINFYTKYMGTGIVDEKAIIIAKGNINYYSYAELKEGEANMISKIVTYRDAKVKNVLKLKAIGSVKGYVKCDGLMLEDSYQETIPILGSKCKKAELHHEAKIGRVSQEVLEYLESKGLTEEEAISLYVRGFVTSILPELDERLKLQILGILSKAQGL